MAKKTKASKHLNAPADEFAVDQDEAAEDDQGEEHPGPVPEAAPKQAPASNDPEGSEAEKQDAGEPGSPPPGSHKITIDGEGTVPIVADGAMQRLERGTPVKVTDAQLEALKAADIPFKKAK